MDHGIEEQRLANDALRRIGRDNGIGFVATNDCHYLQQSDHLAHDVLLCIGTQRVLSDRERLRYASDQFYLKTADEMRALFPRDALSPSKTRSRSRIVVDSSSPRARSTFRSSRCLPGKRSTRTSSRWRETDSSVGSAISPRRHQEGRSRHPPEVYRDRLEAEIAIIRDMGFSGYFLIVWDFCRYAPRERDFRSARDAAPPPAPSPRTSSASRTSIRSSTTCCSNAS